MVIKKDLVIAVLATFCLTFALFTVLPTRSSTTNEPKYDPWADLNDDGIIDIYDVTWLCTMYDTTGTPINKTALLYEVNATFTELLSRISNLNASLLDMEAYLNTKITDLNTSLVEFQSRIAELETELAILNATKLGKPDYDSGWFNITQGKSVILTHNLTTTNVLVYMIGKYSDYASPYIHQHDYGGELSGSSYYGAYWSDLTKTTIRVTRQGQDANWNYIRVVIWKIP